jgi:arsenate reductase
MATEGLRSKSWDEFAAPGAPYMDFVFTVCDNPANDVCPHWQGHPMIAHWGLPDPTAAKGSAQEIEEAFGDAFRTLDRRISLLLLLPLDALQQPAIQREIKNIGRS